MRTFRIAVGHEHGVKPGNIVGAIANEANIDSKFIGRIDIYDDYTVLDLPDSLPQDMMEHLKSVRVAGQALNIRADGASASAPAAASFSKAPAPAASKLTKVVERATRFPGEEEAPAKSEKKRLENKGKVQIPMLSYRIEVGREHAVTPSNIVGAIANEAGLEAKHIGKIAIFDDYTTLELPDGMPPEVLTHLKGVWVANRQLKISPVAAGSVNTDKPAKFSSAPSAFGDRKAGGDRRVLEKAAPHAKKDAVKRPFKSEAGSKPPRKS